MGRCPGSLYNDTQDDPLADDFHHRVSVLSSKKRWKETLLVRLVVPCGRNRHISIRYMAMAKQRPAFGFKKPDIQDGRQYHRPSVDRGSP